MPALFTLNTISRRIHVPGNPNARASHSTTPEEAVLTTSVSSVESSSVATPQTARGWARPPCTHFNIQSCCCLGSASEVAAFQTLFGSPHSIVRGSQEMELELGEEEAVGKEGEDGMRVWQPGMEEGDADQELEFDPSAYDCLHAMRLEWPCLRCVRAPRIARVAHGARGCSPRDTNPSSWVPEPKPANLAPLAVLHYIGRKQHPKLCSHGGAEWDAAC
jgi:hypothetical protein